jgi:hypothetical protein
MLGLPTAIGMVYPNCFAELLDGRVLLVNARRMRENHAFRRTDVKATQSHIKATPKPVDSQLIGTTKPP